MKSIEFFGVSDSGKTFYKNKIKNFFSKKKFYDYKSIILNFSQDKISLSKLDYLTLFYFKIIKSDFIKKIISKNKKNLIAKTGKKIVEKKSSNIRNIFYLNYKKICKRLFVKLKKKDIKFCKFVFNLIDNLKCNQNLKKTLKFWFIEEYCAHHLLRNYEGKILLDSEGFIQRLSIYVYFSTSKDHHKIISKYLSMCPLPQQILITKFNKNKSIIKKKTISEIIESKKENAVFYKIKKVIYALISSKKIKINIYEIKNKISFNRIII